MNWTEGNLARHGRGRKGRETMLRQKEHFAKARSRILNSKIRTSPSFISFLAQQEHTSSPTRNRSIKEDRLLPFPKKRTEERDPLQTSPHFGDTTLELPTPAGSQAAQAEEDSLRRKRRKLLLKGDWVGTDVQKPIAMEFSRQRVSSCENPWANLRPKNQRSGTRLRHILGVKAIDGQTRAAKAICHAPTPVSRGQVRIRLGSHERELRDSSDASSRGQDHRSHGGIFRYNLTSRDMDGRGCDRVTSSESVPAGADSSKRSVSDRSGQAPISTDSPMLYHPVPLRAQFSQILPSRSSDSDDARSTKAQVGICVPELSSSQIEQNEGWLNFVRGQEHDHHWSDTQLSAGEDSGVQGDISPGVSQYGHFQRPRHTCADRGSEYQEWTGINDEILAADPLSSVQRTPELSREFRTTISGEDPTRDVSDLLTKPEQCNERSGIDDCMLHGSSSHLQSDCVRSSLEPDSLLKDMVPNPVQEIAQNENKTVDDYSDEVSLLVVPSSPAIVSRDISRRSDGFSQLQRPAADVQRGSQPAQGQHVQGEASRLASSLQDQSRKSGRLSPKPLTFEDENAMWRDFILGGSSDNFDKAMDEAIKETARNLRPSETPTSNDDDCASNGEHLQKWPCEKPSSPSQESSIHLRDFATDYEQTTSENCFDTISASNQATIAYSSPDPLSEPIPLDTHDHTGNIRPMPSLDATPDLMDSFLRRSGAPFIAKRESDNASLVNHPPSIPAHDEEHHSFTFVPPKPFLGRKNGHLDEQRHIALSAPQIRGKTATYHRQKRMNDGRTKIRKLPAFSGDPIEDFEDDVSMKQTQNPSLLGSLDTMDDFEA